MLNKPFGVISALHDPEGRPLATQYLKDVPNRVYPVGRLDFDSLGLLLFTNDGQWAHRLTHPRYHVPRTYKIIITGNISHKDLQTLEKGVHLEDGFSGTAKVTLLNRGSQQSVIRMTITSGRNRIVRRMFEATGYRVVHLLRIGFGPLELGDLKVGEFRYLEEEEVTALQKSVGLA
jgi:23S rRNA pseudouridine2605 synthase